MAYNQYSQNSQPQTGRGQYQGQPPSRGGPNGQYQVSNNEQQYGRYQAHQDYVQQSARPYASSDGYPQPQRGGDTYQQATHGYRPPHGYRVPQQQQQQQQPPPPPPGRQQPNDHGLWGNGQQYTGSQTRPSLDRGERQGRERHRPPDLASPVESQSKSRERILPSVESPVAIAWDNPFPAFNAKKDTKKYSGVNKAISQINPSGQSDQQSPTSQGHRPGEQARPHTSQGHRRPGPPVTSPGPRSANPISPNAPSVAPYTSQKGAPSQRSPDGHQALTRPPLTRLASDRPVASGHDEAIASLPKPQRSMTMPEEVATGMGKRKLHKNPNGQISRHGSDTARSPQEPYHYVPTPISPVAAVERTASASHNVLFSPEMPNFDAISPTANEKSEDPLHRVKPAYQKPSYAGPAGFAPFSKDHPPAETVPGPAERPEFAGFAFDLPNSSNFQRSSPTDQHASHPSYKQMSPTSPGPHSPSAEARNQPYSQSTAGQYSGRSGSGHGPQQAGSVGNPQRYGSPNPQQRQYRSTGEMQQYPPAQRYHSPSHDVGYDYGRVEYNDRARQNHPPPPDQRRFYPSQGQYPAQNSAGQDPNHGSQQYTGPALNPGHPPPSRQHPPSNTASPGNPDALPAHPVPVRPGLLRKESAGSAVPTQERNGVSYPAPTASLTPMPAAVQEDEKPAAVSAFDLNLLVQTTKKNPNDRATMMTLVKRLVEAASVLSSEGGKADAKTTQKNRERYISDAHKYLKKLVHKGYGDAVFYMAECYGHGRLGLAVDQKEAFHLYTSAAKGGHAQAAYRVAVCYEMGSEEGGGTRRDPIKAVHWYKRAASMGDTPAMYKTGIILLKGLLGQPKDPREALSWLKRAAEKADRDNPHALHELALLHEGATPGDAIIKDEAYARQLFIQAAELGYKYSQFRLGSASEYGLLGCAIDARNSIAWYTRAAGQGEHQSELALSGWYLTGADGMLQQSDTEAYLWARRAASSGLAKAEYAMGYFTEVGIGCTANLDEAKKWYWRAASQNLPQARQRLEDLKKGGGKMQKTRVSRSAMNRGNEGDCRVM